MSDYCWGLQQLGHDVTVVCNDATYLGESSHGPNGERVVRTLHLKGSFENGVQMLQDARACQAVDEWNYQIVTTFTEATQWDGLLIGNLDLLGPELLIHLSNRNSHNPPRWFCFTTFSWNAISPTRITALPGRASVQRSPQPPVFLLNLSMSFIPGQGSNCWDKFTGRMLPEPLGVTHKPFPGYTCKAAQNLLAVLMASKGPHWWKHNCTKAKGVTIQPPCRVLRFRRVKRS